MEITSILYFPLLAIVICLQIIIILTFLVNDFISNINLVFEITSHQHVTAEQTFSFLF